MKIVLKWIEHGTPEWQAEVDLRDRVLRAPLGLTFTPEQLEAEASDLHLVAFADGVPVGCLVLTPQRGGALQMRQLAVEPGRQGTGIGRRLVETAERMARAHGFHEMMLHARDTAIPFYLRLGYEVRGEPFEEVTLPHREMAKAL